MIQFNQQNIIEKIQNINGDYKFKELNNQKISNLFENVLNKFNNPIILNKILSKFFHFNYILINKCFIKIIRLDTN